MGFLQGSQVPKNAIVPIVGYVPSMAPAVCVFVLGLGIIGDQGLWVCDCALYTCILLLYP